MRVLFVLSFAMLPLASSAAPPSTQPADKVCDTSWVQHAQAPRTATKAYKLGELPPGDLVLAVQREIDGCHEPVIVRHDIGSRVEQPKRSAPKPRRGLGPQLLS